MGVQLWQQYRLCAMWRQRSVLCVSTLQPAPHLVTQLKEGIVSEVGANTGSSRDSPGVSAIIPIFIATHCTVAAGGTQPAARSDDPPLNVVLQEEAERSAPRTQNLPAGQTDVVQTILF